MLNRIKHVVLSVLALLIVAVMPAQAEFVCKGAEKSLCVNNESCRWVNSYTRSDGVQIKGHCRALPVKQPSSGKK